MDPYRHLLLIRHGQPVDSDDDNGIDDPPLGDAGKRQAERVCQRIIRERPDRIVSSPLARARETAEPVADALGLPIETLDAVAEVDFHSGTPYVSVERLRRMGGAKWDELLTDPVGALGGNTDEFRAIVVRGLESLLAGNSRQKIAVFTHGLPINAMLAHCLENDNLTKFIPHYCSITRLLGTSLSNVRILSVNETGHFEPDDLRR